MHEPRRAVNADGSSWKASFADLKVLLQTPSYVCNTLGMTAMTFALGGLAFWMPRYIVLFRGEGTLADVGTKFGGITVVSGLVATLAGGYVGDKLRNRFPGSYFLVSGVGMLIGLPLFLGFLVVPFPFAWGLLFAAEFCLFFNTGPSNTILANVTHPAVRASAFAVNILIIHMFGDAISPSLIGWITDSTKSAELPVGNMNLSFGAGVSLAIFLSGVFWMLGEASRGRYELCDAARQVADPPSALLEAADILFSLALRRRWIAAKTMTATAPEIPPATASRLSSGVESALLSTKRNSGLDRNGRRWNQTTNESHSSLWDSGTRGSAGVPAW